MKRINFARRTVRKTLSVVLALCVLLSLGAAAALTATAAGTTRVYIYDDSGWGDEIKAHAYRKDPGEDVDLTGAWGDFILTSEGGGWFYGDIPSDPTFQIIFTKWNMTGQFEVTIGDSGAVYFATSDTAGASGRASKSEVTGGGSEDGITRVYIYDDAGWGNVVKAHAYRSESDGDVDLTGTWGDFTLTSEGDGWFYGDIPSDPTFNVMFAKWNMTDSFEVTIRDSSAVYFATSDAAGAAGRTSKAAVTGEEPTEPVNGTTFYFYNNVGWTTVNAHLYNTNSSNTDWPGKPCINEGNGWWKITIDGLYPTNDDVNIIFNGSGGSVAEIPFYTSANEWVYFGNYGSDRAYSSKADVFEALGIEVPVDPEMIISEDYTVDGDYLKAVPAGTSVSEIDVTAQGAEIVVYDAAGDVKADGNIATGDVVAMVLDDEILESYTVVIAGDLNGDGAVDALDLVVIREKLLGVGDGLEGAYLEAANTNDSAFDIKDLIVLKKLVIAA